MKKLGLIGGTGPAATIDYYRTITSGVRETAGVIPALAIDSIQPERVFEFCRKEDWEGFAEYLLSSIRSLKAAGAEFASFTGMTPHRVFDRVAEKSPLPLVHLLHPAVTEAQRRGFEKVLLLGSRTVMNGDFARKPFLEAGIEIAVPSEKDQAELQEITEREIEYGLKRPESVRKVLSMISRTAERGSCSAVILANTDFPAFFRGETFSLPAIAPAALHMAALVGMIAGSDPEEI